MSARYDRQLRIWGAHGQQRLEKARICVLNSGPCGTEALKNLVLGGMGGFTLVDDGRVEDEDYGRNYLVDVKGKGEPRVEVVLRLLKEMNDSSAGIALMDSPAKLIDERPEFFKDFTLVIATQMQTEQIRTLRNLCLENSIPLITLHSYGLLGMMRIYLKEAVVVESKPEDKVPDLRLAEPWPELLEFAKSIDFNGMEEAEHSHIPYVVILLQAGENWRVTSNGHQIPCTSEQKSAYRAAIQALRLTEKKTNIEEENFDEAIRAAYQFWTPYSTPQAVQEILEDSCVTSTMPSSSEFWIIAAALKEFLQRYGTLPLNGSIPDMTSTTEFYLKLQEIYSAKARDDVEKVSGFVEEILKQRNLPATKISKQAIALVCKNARNLRLVRSEPPFLAEDPLLYSRLRDCDTFHSTSYALLLESVNAFERTHGRVPGNQPGEDWPEDGHLLMNVCQGLTDLTKLEPELALEMQSMAVEICRFGGYELHNVSAVMGGIAAQEAIKILTNQFVPFKGTLFYNAMNSTTTKF